MNAVVSLDFERRPSAVPYMVRAMVPVPRHVDLAPAIVAHWQGHRPDPRALESFRRITGLPAGGTSLPLLYPHTFGFRLSMAILTHPRFPVPIWGVLQTRNHLVQHRALRVDEPLDFAVSVAHRRAVPKGAEFDLLTTVHVAGELTWESVITFLARGRFGEPGPTRARGAARGRPRAAATRRVAQGPRAPRRARAPACRDRARRRDVRVVRRGRTALHRRATRRTGGSHMIRERRAAPR